MRSICFFIFLGMFLYSCTPEHQSAIAPFAQATSSLADQGSRTFTILDSVTYERRFSMLAISPGTPLEDNDFTGWLDANQDLNDRIKLFNSLKQYAISLGKLDAADNSTDINDASTKLYGSLGSLQSGYQSLTHKNLKVNDNDLKIISTVIEAIGKQIVEKKKEKAIKLVVIQTDSAVQQICQLLSTELPLIKDNVTRDLHEIYQDLKKDYEKNANDLSYDQRVAYLRRIDIQYHYWKGSGTFFDNLISLSKKISAAHSELKKAVQSGKLSTPELIRTISDMSAFANQTSAFFNSLNAKK